MQCRIGGWRTALAQFAVRSTQSCGAVVMLEQASVVLIDVVLGIGIVIGLGLNT